MLPPISLPTNDLLDFGPDTSADMGFYRPTVEFQQSFDEYMSWPVTADPLPLEIETGELLPPDGNELPVGTPILVPPQVGPMPVRVIPVSASEEARDAESLAVANPLNEARNDIADVGVVAIESPVVRSFRGDNMRQPGDIQSGEGIRSQIQEPLAPRNVPVFNGPQAGLTAEQIANRQLDAADRLAVVHQQLSTDARETAQLATNIAASNPRAFAEKFDGLQKRVDAIVSPSSVVAADNLQSLQAPGQTARIAPPPLLPTSINTPLQDDGWGEALSERVMWMAGKSIQRAEIRMNPAELGPIRVEVSVTDDVATVTFNAQHAVTREAIELAMPRLREMLGENGISLANPDISDTEGSPEQQARDSDAVQGDRGDAGGPEDGEAAATSSLASRSSSALVDTFA